MPPSSNPTVISLLPSGPPCKQSDRSSHANYGAFAIGGLLKDAAPTISKTVGGHSWVGSLSGSARFIFEAGVTVGGESMFPINWAHVEYLATTIQPSRTVHVKCAGGRFDIASVHSRAGLPTGTSGGNVLVVFNTHDDVTLGATFDGRQFTASVLAPFSKVTLEGSIGYVDGYIIAKALQMSSTDSSSQIHGRCYSGGSGDGILCGGDGSRANCPSSPLQPTVRCADRVPTRRCLRKARKGKCRKRRMREEKCMLTCNHCGTM